MIAGWECASNKYKHESSREGRVVKCSALEMLLVRQAPGGVLGKVLPALVLIYNLYNFSGNIKN